MRHPGRIALLLVFAFGLPPGATAAQAAPTTPLWGELEPGPFGVGFKVLFRFDPSRTYRPSRDANDEPTARPQRIMIWYPAAKEGPAQALKFRDVLYVEPDDPALAAWNRKLVFRDERNVQAYGISERLFELLLDTPILSRRDAVPAAGRYPLVLHSVGRNMYRQESLVLWEYLASHGFVVASIPQFGHEEPSMTLGPIGDPSSQEAQVRDLEFAVATLRELDFVDPGKLAMTGFSGGSRYALLFGMRHPEGLDALVSLDGSIAYGEARGLLDVAYYDPRVVRFPILNLHKSSDNLDLRMLDSFVGSERYRFEFPKAYHLFFSQLPMILNLDPSAQTYLEPPEDDLELARRTYETVCRYSLWFLQAYLTDSTSARAALMREPPDHGSSPDLISHWSRQPAHPVPTEWDISRVVVQSGLSAGLSLFRTARSAAGDAAHLDSQLLRRIALFDLAWHGELAAAVALFRFGVEIWPDSAEAWEGLSDGLERAEQRDEALAAARRALTLLATDPSLEDGRSEQLRRRLESRIERLEERSG